MSKRLDDLLASLLKQLAEGENPLPKAVKDLYDRHKKDRTRPSLEDFSKTLQSVAASYPRVFVLVDALDECQVAGGCRTRFLSEMFTLQEKSGVRLMATSRFIPEITERFKESETLEILASSEDVHKYLEGQLFQLPSFVTSNAELQEQIKTSIVQSVHGMYVLGIHLATQTLTNSSGSF